MAKIESGIYVEHANYIGIEMWKREKKKWYHLVSYSDNTVKWVRYPKGPVLTKIIKLQDVNND